MGKYKCKGFSKAREFSRHDITFIKSMVGCYSKAVIARRYGVSVSALNWMLRKDREAAEEAKREAASH